MKITRMQECHLDDIARLEEECFSHPWSRQSLAEELENPAAVFLTAIEDGYTHFISGFAAGADLLFSEIVAGLKEIYPITLEAAIPYPGRMKTPDKTFRRLIRCCDTVKVHSNGYFKGCYMRRNRYMINQSQRVIAVYDGRPTGGTATTVRYAKGKDVRVVWK